MPSKFTEHFNLNQWEKTDKVLMEDFSADNRKIDAAFLNHRSAELIFGGTVERDDISLVELDVSQLDWSRYFMLYLSVQTVLSGELNITTDVRDYRCFQYHRENYDYVGTSGVLGHFFAGSNFRAMFFTTYSEDTIPVLFGLSSGKVSDNKTEQFSFTSGRSGQPYKAIGKLNLRTPGNSLFSVGTKIELWGVK